METPSHRTDWFHKAGWGAFTHYMSDTVGADNMDPKKWNATVDSFDTDALARQLADIGAGYYCITLGQNSGYYCSPNATYDDIVRHESSHCSSRDLIADLANSLARKNIGLLVYLPSGAPDRDKRAVERLKWQAGNHRLAEFQRMWEDVISEWSVRWGDAVRGWWFDGCYYADAMYRHGDAPNFRSFAVAARAGNSGSIVAFNPGVLYPIVTVTEHEDYTAGEINDALAVHCDGRWVGRAQWHMLTFLGPRWFGDGEPPRYDEGDVIRITRDALANGGVVSWDVTIDAVGRIHDDYARVLAGLNRSLTTEPFIRGGRPVFQESLHVELVPPRGPKAEIRYRLDGQEPTSIAPRYSGTIVLSRTSTIKARCYSVGEPHPIGETVTAHFECRPPVPPGNVAAFRPAALLTHDGSRRLEANSGIHHARCGVDGDAETRAQAGGQWAWTYQVDLEGVHSVKRIVVTFHKEFYATHYRIDISPGGSNWKTVGENAEAGGGKLEHDFEPTPTRFIRVVGLKPDGPDQPGSQMSVVHLEAYSSGASAPGG